MSETTRRILTCLIQSETVTPQYMERHPCLAPKCRGILLDWLVCVVKSYSLSDATLHLACSYIDAYMAAVDKEVTMDGFQLGGVTALFIASKMEDTPKCITLGIVAYVCDYAFTINQVLNMEMNMCTVLQWKLAPATAYTFVQYADSQFSGTACYILELLLLDFINTAWVPSKMACTALCLAHAMHAQPCHSIAMYGYTISDLQECATAVCEMLDTFNFTGTEVQKKYAESSLAVGSHFRWRALLLTSTFHDEVLSGK